MTTTPLTMTLGTLRAAHVRLWTPWAGRWIADVDVDLDKSGAVPSGAQVLTINAATLSGTVDETRVGRFGEKATLRLLGGAGGWHRTVDRRHFHNDAGLMSDAVLDATAKEVGETIVDAAPVRLGVDFVRAQGPASDVLRGRTWFVGFDGKTTAGDRPEATAPKSAEVLSWSGLEQRAELAADELLVPGTTITDGRFGTIVLRDIEQTFGDGAARATAWCGPAGVSRLVDSIVSLVLHRLGVKLLGKYLYRIVTQNVDGRLELQAIELERGLPDTLPLYVWPGMAGLSATGFTPGTQVVVEFIAGDPARPIVTSFDGQAPIVLNVDAQTSVNIGGTSAAPLAKAAELETWAAAVVAACAAHTPPITIAPLSPTVATLKARGA